MKKETFESVRNSTKSKAYLENRDDEWRDIPMHATRYCDNRSSVKRQAGTAWAAYAPYYDLMMVLMTLGKRKKAPADWTIKLSQIKPGDKVLEIGCGTGTLTLAAKARVGPSGEVSGIDIAAPEMVARARRKAIAERRRRFYTGREHREHPVPGQSFRHGDVQLHDISTCPKT